jgi:hypothetical protein
MPSSGMFRRVALVKTGVLEELRVSIIRVTRIVELGTTIAVTISVRRFLVTANFVSRSPILVILMMEAIRSSETSVLTRAIPSNILEDGILHSHRRENLTSYEVLLVLLLPGGTAKKHGKS